VTVSNTLKTCQRPQVAKQLPRTRKVRSKLRAMTGRISAKKSGYKRSTSQVQRQMGFWSKLWKHGGFLRLQ
jgi:hypothetical protein